MIGTLVPLLVMLLAVTTPVGTEDGVHQADLLHPLLPHLHFVNGRLLLHQTAPQPDPAPTPGPAIGGGAGDDASTFGLAPGPALPLVAEALPHDWRLSRVVADVAAPKGRVEAPPDPPPTSAE